MAFTSIPLADEALSLPPEQRHQLALLLVASLETNGPSDDELKRILQSRLNDLRSGQDRGLSFNEVFGGPE